MATDTQSRFGLARELLSFDVYKPTQGVRMRAISAAALGLFVLWGLHGLYRELETRFSSFWIAYGVPLALGLIAAWVVFRLYNWPRFAEFLIATDAEMVKVSWSTWSELKRATAVVLLTLFLLSGFLLSVDMVWSWLLEKIGVLELPSKKAEPPPEAQTSLDLWKPLCDLIDAERPKV